MSLDMFVNESSCFEISIWVGKSKDTKEVYADYDLDVLTDLYEDIDNESIQEVKATFKNPNSEDMFNISSELFDINENLKEQKFRIKRVGILLQSWSLPQPPTLEEVLRLKPIVSIAFACALEQFID